MKLELSENMYVRTKDGYISQYKYYDTTNMGKLLCIPLSNGTFANIEDIIKASYNIIDILEVGDYVNGMPVLHKENDELVCGLLLRYKEENIENIVTKEQFEQMAYKVGE